MAKDIKAERDEALRGFRRRLILDAARVVFESDGLERGTMRAIATQAGCTTGAIYPVFKSKEDIYAAILATSLEDLQAFVSEAIGKQASGKSRLEAGIRAFAGYYSANPAEFTLGFHLYGGAGRKGLTRVLDENLNARLAQTLNLFEVEISDLLDGDNQRAKTLVASVFANLAGTLLLSLTGRLGVLHQRMDAVVEMQIAQLIGFLDRDDRGTGN